MTDRWKRGSLADDISKLVWAVDRHNQDAVRSFADRVQALEDELRKEERLSGCSSEREARLIARAESAEQALVKARAELAVERAAVVAFLRETLATSETAQASDDLDYAIDIIERGEHRREEEP